MELPDTWTLIAVSNYRGGWDQVGGAVLSIELARKMLEGGDILMAQRRLGPNQMGLLVKGRVNG